MIQNIIFPLTAEEIDEIIDSRLLSPHEWLFLIQQLSYPDARYHVEYYRGYLKWLIDTDRVKIKKNLTMDNV